jgi:hypothetical protein
MLDVRNPEIDVDDIMRRIQEKVRIAAAYPVDAPPPEASLPTQSLLSIGPHLARAREHAQVGVVVPPMTRTTGFKRAVATRVANLFLRVAQLITRDQREFNDAIVTTSQAFLDRLAQQSAEAADLAGRVERLEAQIRKLEGAGRGP